MVEKMATRLSGMGIILASGRGTRLYPLTRETNKSLPPLDNRTLVEHVFKQLIGDDIKSILPVTDERHVSERS